MNDEMKECVYQLGTFFVIFILGILSEFFNISFTHLLILAFISAGLYDCWISSQKQNDPNRAPLWQHSIFLILIITFLWFFQPSFSDLIWGRGSGIQCNITWANVSTI
jgi:hypothetical protein